MKKDLLVAFLCFLLSACVCVGVTAMYKTVHKPYAKVNQEVI